MRGNNGIGIAAPQVGIGKQLFVFELDSKGSGINCPNFPLTAFFNPSIEMVDDDYVVGKDSSSKKAGSSKNLLNLMRYKRILQSPTTTAPRVPTANNTISMWESCLSVPNYYGKVTRARRCILKFTDIAGVSRSIEADGIIAACLQHENDHLLGRVYVDRLKNGAADLIHIEEMSTNDLNNVFSLTGDFQITK
eukprot:gene12998-15289_t